MLPQKVLHLHKALEKKKPKVNGEYILTEKLDGNYVYIDFNATTGKWSPFISSGNNAISALNWISMSEHGFNPTQSCRFIFEAYIPDGTVYDVNSRLKRKYEQAKDILLYLHDVVFFTMMHIEALARYRQYVCDITETSVIKKIPFIGVSSDRDYWEKQFEKVIDSGGEGIVLKRCNGLYTPGARNESLMKLKQEVTLDLLCTEIYQTTGKQGETSVNLVLQRANGTKITVVVPKDSDQQHFINNPIEVLDKVCEIRAMKEHEDGTLREPRFRFIREDKLPHEID